MGEGTPLTHGAGCLGEATGRNVNVLPKDQMSALTLLLRYSAFQNVSMFGRFFLHSPVYKVARSKLKRPCRYVVVPSLTAGTHRVVLLIQVLPLYARQAPAARSAWCDSHNALPRKACTISTRFFSCLGLIFHPPRKDPCRPQQPALVLCFTPCRMAVVQHRCCCDEKKSDRVSRTAYQKDKVGPQSRSGAPAQQAPCGSAG